MRDPEAFGRNMETVLRGAALLALTQVKLKMTEETYKGCHDRPRTGSWRMSPLKADVNDIRFNFTPSFTRVGDQFIVASTVELCRTLVDEVRKEQQGPKDAGALAVCRPGSSPAASPTSLKAFEDRLVTQTILDQAVPPAEAQAQVKALVQWVRGLGEMDVEQAYTTDSFRFDLRWKMAK